MNNRRFYVDDGDANDLIDAVVFVVVDAQLNIKEKLFFIFFFFFS